jgi:hypothetical protein
MTLKFKHKKILPNLILGCVWLVYSLCLIMFKEPISWYDYIWLLFSVIYFAIYFYQKKEQYITLKDGVIKQNWPFGKTILLKDITKVKYFAGDFIITSKTKTLTINTQLLEETSYKYLKTELKNTNADWQ